MKKRTTNTLSRLEIYNIATAYAYSKDLSYSYYQFRKQYPEFSAAQYYKILHMAIDKAIVSESEAKQIASVSALHALIKACMSGFDFDSAIAIHLNVYNKWHNRITKLRKFHFSKPEAIQLIEQYANSSISAIKFFEINCISKELFVKTLSDAIVNDWLSPETIEKLFYKAMSEQNFAQYSEFFFKLRKQAFTTKRKKQKTSKSNQ